ncbi:hypothetical protein BOX15_Mlig011361g1, partial [Macrostomum lignano]
LLCRLCLSSATRTVAAASRRLGSSSVATMEDSSSAFRFGQLANRNKANRRRVEQQQQPMRTDKSGFEFGALARTSSLVEPPESARIDIELGLEEAADAMSESAPDDTVIIDEDRLPDHRPLARVGRKHDEGWYLRRLDKLAEAGDTAGIVRLLHRDMIGEDRFLPTRRIMNQTMRHLASVGAYDEVKAVMNRCRSAGVEPNYATHCHYLHSLAKASYYDGTPDRVAGELACRYYHALCEDSKQAGGGGEQHRYVYYFAVLACAKNGLVQEALKIFDDSVSVGQQHPLPTMLNALLQAAFADKTSGSAIALLVWRRFRLAFGGRLSAHHYHRLLRCLRACGIGQPSLMAAAEAAAGPPARAFMRSGSNRLGDGQSGDVKGSGAGAAMQRLQDGWSAELDAQNLTVMRQPVAESAAELPQSELDFSLPAQPPAALALSCPLSLLRPRQPLPSLPDSPDALRLPWQRLTLIGGLAGLLESMRADGAEPTPAIAFELMEMLPPIPEAERTLMRLCRSRGFHRASTPGGGANLYNALLRYRVRNRLDCSDTLDEMRSNGLRPDRDTYVALGGACRSKEAAERLLADMARDAAQPDQAVFHAMLSAAQPYDLAYRIWLVRRMTGFDVPPSPAVVRLLEAEVARCRDRLPAAAASSASSLAVAEVSSACGGRPVDPKEYQLFRSAYESWLKANPLFKSHTNARFERLRLKQARQKALKLDD